MNQTQREYLIKMVDDSFKEQKKKIEAKRFSRPNLNNFLVAACLDGSLQLADLTDLKAKIHAQVMQHGPNDKLIKNKDRKRSSWSDPEDTGEYEVMLDVRDIFIIPEAYEQLLREWQANEDAVNAEIEALTANRNTVVTKIQIGSNAVLDKLVVEIDNIGDLSLFNTQFITLSGGGKKPELTNG